MRLADKYCMSIMLILSFFCTFFDCKTSSAGQDDAEQILRVRVPSECEKFAKQLDAHSISIEGKAETVSQSGERKNEIRIAALTKKQGQFYITKVEREGGDLITLECCYGINSKYCFELLKNKAGNAWLLSKVAFVVPGFDDTE